MALWFDWFDWLCLMTLLSPSFALSRRSRMSSPNSFVLASSGASESLNQVPRCYVPSYVQEQRDRESKTRWKINGHSTGSKSEGNRFWKQVPKKEGAEKKRTPELTDDSLVRPNSVLLSHLGAVAKEAEERRYKEVEFRALRERLRFKEQQGSRSRLSTKPVDPPSTDRGQSSFGPFVDSNGADARERRAAGWLQRKANAPGHAPILINSTSLYGGLQKSWRSGDVQQTPFNTMTPASGTPSPTHRPVIENIALPLSQLRSSSRPRSVDAKHEFTPKRRLVLDRQLHDPKPDFDLDNLSSSDDAASPSLLKKRHRSAPQSSGSSDEDSTAFDAKRKAKVMLSLDMEQVGGGQFVQVTGSAPRQAGSSMVPSDWAENRRRRQKLMKELQRFEAYNPSVIMPSLRDQIAQAATSRPSSGGVEISVSPTDGQPPERVGERLLFDDSSDEEYFVSTIATEKVRLEKKGESLGLPVRRATVTSTSRQAINVPTHLKPIEVGAATQSSSFQTKSHDQLSKEAILRASNYFSETELLLLQEESDRLRGQYSLPRTNSTKGIRRVESSAQLVRRASGLGQFFAGSDQTPLKGQKSVNFANAIGSLVSPTNPNHDTPKQGGPSSGVGGILKQPLLNDLGVDTPPGSVTLSPTTSFLLRPQRSKVLAPLGAKDQRRPQPNGAPVSLDVAEAPLILRELYRVTCPTHEDREGAYVSALGGLSFNMDFAKFKKLVRGLIPHPGGPVECQHYQPISDDVALGMFAAIIEFSSHLQNTQHTITPHNALLRASKAAAQGNAKDELAEEDPVVSKPPAPTTPTPNLFGHRQLASGLISAGSTLPPTLQVTISYVRFLSGLCQVVLSPAQLKFIDSLYIVLVNSPHVGYYLYHLKYQVVNKLRARLEVLRDHKNRLSQTVEEQQDREVTTVNAQGRVRQTSPSSRMLISPDLLNGHDPDNWVLVGSLGDRMPIPVSALTDPQPNGRLVTQLKGNESTIDTPRRKLVRSNSVTSTNSRVSSIASPSSPHHGRKASPPKSAPTRPTASVDYAIMLKEKLQTEVSKLMTLTSSLEFTLIGDPLGDMLRTKSFFITRRRNRERVQLLLHEQQQQQRRIALEQLSRKQQEHRRRLEQRGEHHDNAEESGLEAELLALMEESMLGVDLSKNDGESDSLNLYTLGGGVHGELLGGPDSAALQKATPSVPALTRLGAVFTPPTSLANPGAPTPTKKGRPPADAALINYFRYRKESDVISDLISALDEQLDLIRTRSAMVAGKPVGEGAGSSGLQGGLYTVAATDDVFRAPGVRISGGSRSSGGLPFTPGDDVSRPDLLLSLFLPTDPSAISSKQTEAHLAPTGVEKTASPAVARRDSISAAALSYGGPLSDVGGVQDDSLTAFAAAHPGLNFATFVVRDAVFNLKGVSMQFPHPEEDNFVAAVMSCLCEVAVDTAANLLQDQLSSRTAERECEEAEEKALVALETALRSSLVGEDIAVRDGPQASPHARTRHSPGLGSRSVTSDNDSASHSTQSRSTPSTMARRAKRPPKLGSHLPPSNAAPTKLLVSEPTGLRAPSPTTPKRSSRRLAEHVMRSREVVPTTLNPWAGQSLSEKSKHYNVAIYEAAPLAPPPLAHLSLDDFRMLLFCDNNAMRALAKIVPPTPSPVSGIFGAPTTM